MSAKITFFPVGNGDMTLIRLANTIATSLLIDCKIRAAADSPDDPTPDVAKELRKRIKTDNDNRPYVDGMLLSHPDEDHCLGLEKHFWLGPIEDYADDDKPENEKRIIIREMWSSPMVFRRASKNLTLCSDAKAFSSEARRRVQANRDHNFAVPEGDRILILGEDENGKTNDLEPILIKAGESRKGVNGEGLDYLTWKLLGPMAKQDDDTEETLSKNGSSVIINFSIKFSEYESSFSQFLTGGDADVSIWEKIWANFSSEDLKYDLLLAPHHCSWRTLSHDSWSEKGEEAVVSADARSALSQSNSGAIIVSSSKPINGDDDDPPYIRAKREYRSMQDGNGLFKCTGEEPSKAKPAPLEIETTGSGFKICVAAPAAIAVAASSPSRAGNGN
ncbi:cobalamin biosynthesis protein CobQ [Microbulbifer sp. ANSA005]|uniref:cobalamin biosynthesis protein CobQ n=1 Tax=Microbulbifer sp. ANSA005 TaxID=3243362 RepID=UPI004042BCBD